MLLTIYYRKGCIKSRFLRTALKIMDFELRELVAGEPAAEAEMVQLKMRSGQGNTAFAPSIYSGEVYSHELYPIIEYLNERSPEGMFPAEIALRLASRTLIRRTLMDLSALWPSYIASGDAKPILDYYDAMVKLIVELLSNRASWRVLEQRPTYVEILFLSLVVEVNYHRPIKNSVIVQWLDELASTPAFQPALVELMAEPKNGYHAN